LIYLQLFWSFIQIGMFSFGGGYAAMPLIQGQVVNTHEWLTMTEFTDLITISQMTPGPIAVNSATFVGMKIAGIPGGCGYTRLHPAVMHYSYNSGKTVFKISEFGHAAGNIVFPATGSGFYDRFCRCADTCHGFLGKWYYQH